MSEDLRCLIISCIQFLTTERPQKHMSIFRVIKKFSLILSIHQKHRIVQLSILMFIGGILETLSVSLIYPFMNMIMSPDEMMQKSYIVKICSIFNIQSYRVFLVLLAVAIAVIYVLKNVYLLFEYNIQYRFVYGNMFVMQKRILDVLIHRPYEFFLGINSGEIVRIVGTDTTQAFNILTTLLSLFTELTVAVMLIITMFVSAPFITLCIAAVLIVLLLLISNVIKPILQRAGMQAQAAGTGMNKWLLQSIQGIKEIKISSTESFFQNNYDANGTKFVASQRKNQILGVIPRFFLEALCMSTMFIVVAMMLYQGMRFEAIVPMVSIVAMAAIRILPSINRISASITTIAYNEPMLDKLIENVLSMKEMHHNSEAGQTVKSGNYPAECNLTDQIGREEKVTFPNMSQTIALKAIKYRYPNSQHFILNRADMVIENGESVGIVGSTGAGKTTIVDLILGLLNPQGGRIEVDGVDIKTDLQAWISQIGYIPQSIFMLDGSIRENVAFGVSSTDISDDEVWRSLEEAALADFVRILPDGLDTEIGERGVRLSGGQKQRIGIARALYSNTSVLILDEATSALDNDTEAAIMESINGLHGRKTMIIIAHRLTTIKGCDHVFRVEDGKIFRER